MKIFEIITPEFFIFIFALIMCFGMIYIIFKYVIPGINQAFKNGQKVFNRFLLRAFLVTLIIISIRIFFK